MTNVIHLIVQPLPLPLYASKVVRKRFLSAMRPRDHDYDDNNLYEDDDDDEPIESNERRPLYPLSLCRYRSHNFKQRRKERREETAREDEEVHGVGARRWRNSHEHKMT